MGSFSPAVSIFEQIASDNLNMQYFSLQIFRVLRPMVPNVIVFSLPLQAVMLKHVDTGVFLGASGHTFGRPIHGQMEVVGLSMPDVSTK